VLDFNGYLQHQEYAPRDDRELEEIRQAVLDNGETIATYLLGQPNKFLSSKNDLRWGDKGSMAFTPSKGMFFSHEDGIGGDILGLIRREKQLDFAGALAWVREFLSIGGIGHKAAEKAASKPKAPAEPSGHPNEVAYALTKCGPPQGTLLETYLAGRGLTLPPCDDILFAADLAHIPSKRSFPAMVCHIRNSAGEKIGIHRTWLADDGIGKAPVTAGKPKMTMKLGDDDLIGAIRLFPMGDDGWLGVAEGIETALSASKLFSPPVWSCISTAGMKRFEWPEGTRHLVIFADRDEKGAGRKAAEALRDRALAAGLVVEIRTAEGNDFNNDLQAGVFSTDYEEFLPTTLDAIVARDGDESTPAKPGDLMAEIAALTPDDAGKLPVQLAVARAVTSGLNELEIEAILQTISKNTRVSIGTLRSYAKKMAARSGGRQDDADWKKHLILDDTHNPMRTVPNIVTVLNECPEWQGVIKLDEFSGRVMMRRGAPWMDNADTHPDEPWRDTFDTDAACWLAHNVGLNVRSIDVHEAVKTIAYKNKFHPVRDYFDSLVWDGIPRIDTWLQILAGAEDTPYVRAVGSRWLISGVARVFRPGCKVDQVMILEGPQGLKKSTLLSVMGGDWYTDDVSDVGNKDTIMQCHGKLIIEFAELDSISKADVSKIKAFVSRGTDHYRPPYERTTGDFDRQFIFAGTVNPDNTGYLKDPSGGRRFWPVLCTKIDIKLAQESRDQLWAEAVARFREPGVTWWLDEKELIDAAQIEQEARYQGDPWESKIRDFLFFERRRDTNGNFYRSERNEPLTETTASDILEHALVMETGRWGKAEQMRIGHIMKTLGFKNEQRRVGKGKERCYRKLEEWETA
jgi:predicted P-loop ATPase